MSAKKGRKPNREESLERETRAWELRQKLWTHERIAAELGVDRSTITKMLGRVWTRRNNTQQERIDAFREEHTAMLEHIADEAMQAWSASKAMKKDARRRKQAGKEYEENRATSKDADPRFLTEARSALAEIRAVWGVDAPRKTALTDPDGEGAPTIRIEYVNDWRNPTAIPAPGAKVGAAERAAVQPAAGGQAVEEDHDVHEHVR